jgi:uncharacterized coiled-coil DUF342 family protein
MADDTNRGEEVVVLKEIWNELKGLRTTLRSELKETREELSAKIDGVRTELSARIDQTNARIDQTNVRMEEMHDALVHRITDSELRLATATVDLAGTVRQLGEHIGEWRKSTEKTARK